MMIQNKSKRPANKGLHEHKLLLEKATSTSIFLTEVSSTKTFRCWKGLHFLIRTNMTQMGFIAQAILVEILH